MQWQLAPANPGEEHAEAEAEVEVGAEVEEIKIE
jgi:hypothetical protein